MDKKYISTKITFLNIRSENTQICFSRRKIRIIAKNKETQENCRAVVNVLIANNTFKKNMC